MKEVTIKMSDAQFELVGKIAHAIGEDPNKTISTMFRYGASAYVDEPLNELSSNSVEFFFAEEFKEGVTCVDAEIDPGRWIGKDEILENIVKIDKLTTLVQGNINTKDFNGDEAKTIMYYTSVSVSSLNLVLANILTEFSFEDNFRKEAVKQ